MPWPRAGPRKPSLADLSGGVRQVAYQTPVEGRGGPQRRTGGLRAVDHDDHDPNAAEFRTRGRNADAVGGSFRHGPTLLSNPSASGRRAESRRGYPEAQSFGAQPSPAAGMLWAVRRLAARPPQCNALGCTVDDAPKRFPAAAERGNDGRQRAGGRLLRQRRLQTGPGRTVGRRTRRGTRRRTFDAAGGATTKSFCTSPPQAPSGPTAPQAPDPACGNTPVSTVTSP